MKRLVSLFLLSLILLVNNKTIYASNNTSVHLIFNKVSFNKGDIIKLSINLENFSDLNETKIIIKCDENLFKPIMSNGVYGSFLYNSIYEEALLNEYVDGYLRFQLIKKNLDSGYYAGYKNNVGEFSFVACSNISNIYEVFSDGSFSLINSGINITLYDIYNQEIPVNLKYSEKIKVEWNVSKYIVEVNNSLPNYLDDINIVNRTSDEYDLIVENNISTNILDTYIINIILIDKTNSDFLVLSKPIEIVDTTIPIISGSSDIIIDSDKLEYFNLNDYYYITDNYDSVFNPNISYYNKDMVLINSFDSFIKYLSSNTTGYIIINVSDSSSNKSDDFLMKVTINDVTPPKIGEFQSFEVEDYNLLGFNLSDVIFIEDDYDEDAYLVFNTYIGDIEVIDYKKELLEGSSVKLVYFGIDNKLNKTKEYICLITLKDTTAPSINKIEDITLTDKELFKYDFNNSVSITDNIDLNPSIIYKYYIEKELLFDEWKKELAKGNSGYIKYYGVDSSNNKSEEYIVNVKVVDTTAPVINVNNIKSGGKYLVGKIIEYQITDNFNNKLDTVVTLNDEVYVNEEITKVGKYTLRIESIDSNNNRNIVIINFEIIENNFIGCGSDLECYTDNYFDIVLIVIILLIIIVTIIIIKSLINYKKLKKSKNINNINDM